MKKRRDLPTVILRARGRNSINIIIQVPKPYRWKLVALMTGQRSARLRFSRDKPSK